jgi:general stress protein YciG
MAKRKNPAAVALGRKGGRKKVAKGFSAMAPERRREIARKAAAARWGKKDQ